MGPGGGSGKKQWGRAGGWRNAPHRLHTEQRMFPILWARGRDWRTTGASRSSDSIAQTAKRTRPRVPKPARRLPQFASWSPHTTWLHVWPPPSVSAGNWGSHADLTSPRLGPARCLSVPAAGCAGEPALGCGEAAGGADGRLAPPTCTDVRYCYSYGLLGDPATSSPCSPFCHRTNRLLKTTRRHMYKVFRRLTS